MRILDYDAVRAVATPALVFDAVRTALVAHAEDRTTVPPPIHLTFPADDGDAHVKAGFLDGADDFAVKIVSAFYRSGEHGGVVCLCSAHTGAVKAIVDDRGLLTALRTAAAGALATHALARPDARTLGVFGTGEQARLGATWLTELRPLDRILVCGRDSGKVAALPHKNEVPAALFARAVIVVTDDHAQCLHSGDFGHAVRAGADAADADVPLGAVLRDPPVRAADAIAIADLTGVGALDAAVASAVARNLP